VASVFSFGSGRLRTSSARAGSSFGSETRAAALLRNKRRRYHQTKPTTMTRTRRAPIIAPAKAPVPIP
jgi:hypothetical protein